jgi:hypothetical protein
VPESPILDSFNRADGALGAPWFDNAWGDPATWTIVSGVAVPASASGSGIAWDGSGFGGDCEFEYVLNNVPSSTSYHEIRATTHDGTFSGYQLQITATGTWTWFRSDAGVNTSLKGVTGFVREVGSRTCVQAAKSDLIAWYFSPTLKAWIPINAAKDSTYTSGGYFGLEAIDLSVKIDEFRGGPAIPLGVNVSQHKSPKPLFARAA